MKTLLPAVVAAMLALVAIEVDAQATPADRQVDFAIQSSSLAAALDEWAKQTGFQIISPSWDIAKQLAAPKLIGTFSAQSALDRLLKGTPLNYYWLNDRAVSIRSREQGSWPNVLQSGGGDRTQSELQIGQLNSGAIPLVANGSPTLEEAPSTNKVRPTGDANDRTDTRLLVVETLFVTGSRLRPAPDTGPSPVTVVDRERIDQSGASTVPDVLKYLPQQPFTRTEVDDFSGAQYAQLRGLPAGSTLVLINGRRTVATAVNVGQDAFDLNTIPLAAVERIEVLSESASAVYGADAMGGVVNVILKKDIERPEVELHYGAASGGADESRASVGAGYSTERVRGTMFLDYFAREPLLGSDRDRWANQDYRRFGGSDRRATTSNPGNISSLDGGDLPGLSSNTAAIPHGSSGIGLTPADFAGTVGEVNLNRESLRRFESVVLKRERRSIGFFGELDVTPSTVGFVEALYTEEKNWRESNPSGATLLVPAENPFNPFGLPVIADYLFTGLGPTRSTIESDWYHATAGVRGSLGSWDWEISALATEGNSRSWLGEHAYDFARVDAALASTDPATALNVFQDGPGGTPALLSFITAEPSFFRDRSAATSGTAFLRGALFDLPSGSIDAVVGGSRTDEKIKQVAPQFDVLNETDRTSTAGFAEVRVPLVNRVMEVNAIDQLYVQIGARYDHYSDFGSSSNVQYGLVWMPIRDLALRFSSGTSFRPPSLFNLSLPQITFPGIPVTDPRRNEEIEFVEEVFGGNPNLKPEEGKATTSGFVYTPSELPNLRVAASYWRVRIENRASALSADQLLANERLFSGRIVRADPTDADVAAGLPGSLVSVDTSIVNFARLRSSGIDASIS